MSGWKKKQIKNHKIAAVKLGLIKNGVADFIKQNFKYIYEKDVLDFIKKAYKKHGLVNDNKKEFAICAFGKNTNQVHYFPSLKSSKLKYDSLVLLDIWARIDQKGAPYADATFMFYFGKKIPLEIQKTWKVLVKSRDTAIKLIKNKKLPRGLDIDRAAHDIIGKAGLGKYIKHTIGHSLGFKNPHGDLPGINWREYSPILKSVGYTIEPGIYLKDFGMRTEIDFYISDKNEIIITTPIQKSIELIK